MAQYPNGISLMVLPLDPESKFLAVSGPLIGFLLFDALKTFELFFNSFSVIST